MAKIGCKIILELLVSINISTVFNKFLGLGNPVQMHISKIFYILAQIFAKNSIRPYNIFEKGQKFPLKLSKNCKFFVDFQKFLKLLRRPGALSPRPLTRRPPFKSSLVGPRFRPKKFLPPLMNSIRLY